MDTRTGQIYPSESLEEQLRDAPPSERRFFIPVTRDLTPKEKNCAQIRLYSPCGCNSGKKFKFCCHKSAKPQPETNNDNAQD